MKINDIKTKNISYTLLSSRKIEHPEINYVFHDLCTDSCLMIDGECFYFQLETGYYHHNDNEFLPSNKLSLSHGCTDKKIHDFYRLGSGGITQGEIDVYKRENPWFRKYASVEIVNKIYSEITRLLELDVEKLLK